MAPTNMFAQKVKNMFLDCFLMPKGFDVQHGRPMNTRWFPVAVIVMETLID
jgi:hypothetical protein